jgi:hypothetical protein
MWPELVEGPSTGSGRIGVMHHARPERWRFFGCGLPPIGFHSWIFALPT